MMAPKARQVRRGESQAERKRLRQTLGPLRDLIVAPVSMKRYRAAVNYFVFVTMTLFGSVAETYETLDEQLVYFLELLWTEGETKSLAGDTICGIQHHLNCRRTFPGAWRFFTAWKKG